MKWQDIRHLSRGIFFNSLRGESCYRNMTYFGIFISRPWDGARTWNPWSCATASVVMAYISFIDKLSWNVPVSVPAELNRHLPEPGWHDDVIKWKQFPCYWPFVQGSHRAPVNSPHKGQWRGALMLSLICVWIRLNKKSWGWWFETLPCPLWRHCNGLIL